jgi:predicted DsbA family dithiol-disulfide isomerase
MTQSDLIDYADVNGNNLLDLDVYFDFLCPFSYQVSRWVRQVSELMGPDVMAVRWRFLSSQQISKSKAQPGWQIWEQKPGEAVPGLLPFVAGGAAHALGGESALNRFYAALGKLYHEEGLPIWQPQYIEQAWKETQLDAATLAKVLDGSDRSGYEKLKSEHTEAVERYNASETPTLVFEEHRAFSLKLMPAPEDISDSLELFQHIQRLAMGFRASITGFNRTVTAAQQAETDEANAQWLQSRKLTPPK